MKVNTEVIMKRRNFLRKASLGAVATVVVPLLLLKPTSHSVFDVPALKKQLKVVELSELTEQNHLANIWMSQSRSEHYKIFYKAMERLYWHREGETLEQLLTRATPDFEQEEYSWGLIGVQKI